MKPFFGEWEPIKRYKFQLYFSVFTKCVLLKVIFWGHLNIQELVGRAWRSKIISENFSVYQFDFSFSFSLMLNLTYVQFIYVCFFFSVSLSSLFLFSLHALFFSLPRFLPLLLCSSLSLSLAFSSTFFSLFLSPLISISFAPSVNCREHSRIFVI